MSEWQISNLKVQIPRSSFRLPRSAFIVQPGCAIIKAHVLDKVMKEVRLV